MKNCKSKHIIFVRNLVTLVVDIYETYKSSLFASCAMSVYVTSVQCEEIYWSEGHFVEAMWQSKDYTCSNNKQMFLMYLDVCSIRKYQYHSILHVSYEICDAQCRNWPLNRCEQCRLRSTCVSVSAHLDQDLPFAHSTRKMFKLFSSRLKFLIYHKVNWPCILVVHHIFQMARIYVLFYLFSK